MPEAIINASALLRILPFVSTEGSRPVLNGIYLDPSGCIVATNGHILGCEGSAHTVRSEKGVILDVSSKTVIAFLKAATKGSKDTDEWVNIEGDGSVYTLASVDGSVTAATIEGHYPDWRQVVPTGDLPADKETGLAPRVDRVGFNQAYLKRFPASKFTGSLCFRFPENNKRATVVLSSEFPGFFGLIMPLKVDHYPTWKGMKEWEAVHNSALQPNDAAVVETDTAA